MSLFYALMWGGLRRFAGQPIPWLIVCGVPTVVLLLFTCYAPVAQSLNVRIDLYSAVSVGFCVVSVRDARSAQKHEPLSMRRLVTIACLAAVAGTVLRLWMRLHAINSNGSFNWLDTTATINFLTIFVIWNLAILLLVNERLTNRLRDQAQRDGLTLILNRAGFRELAERQRRRCIGDALPAAILLIDLDHFKRVNDGYGHDSGDRLLQAFAELSRQIVRPGDLVARYGGEEFCMLFPNCSEAEAMTIAERLRRRFVSLKIQTDKGPVGTTASIGVASLRLPDESLDRAIGRADQALYLAKQGGRNRS